ncbi:YqcC family protein [Lonsdalea quercina]|uniref:YqcC family protein n=1 Tax=Lonsdalea quercina TaxID=71657 RepID=UPI0039762773
MSEEIQLRQALLAVEHALRESELWQSKPPEAEAFSSAEPFCVDTMEAQQWLQWVLLPRMHALLDSGAPLPARFAIHPYFEMAFEGREEELRFLLNALRELDGFFGK